MFQAPPRPLNSRPVLFVTSTATKGSSPLREKTSSSSAVLRAATCSRSGAVGVVQPTREPLNFLPVPAERLAAVQFLSGVQVKSTTSPALLIAATCSRGGEPSQAAGEPWMATPVAAVTLTSLLLAAQEITCRSPAVLRPARCSIVPSGRAFSQWATLPVNRTLNRSDRSQTLPIGVGVESHSGPRTCARATPAISGSRTIAATHDK